jgi:hypothetical protein
MAIDTRDKRQAVCGAGIMSVPRPDGLIDSNDRRALTGAYRMTTDNPLGPTGFSILPGYFGLRNRRPAAIRGGP